MQLKSKNAIIYGASGAIGSAVAKAFAKNGAKVFLTGQTQEALASITKDILLAGGDAEYAVVDAGNEQSVESHFNSVVAKGGHVDISFNAIGIPQTGVQGIPLLEMTAGQWMLPIISYAKSHFLTARTAGRHMAENKKGVILTLTAIPAKIAAPLVGGMAPAWASIEALTRTFAAELGVYNVRVVCLRPDGIPETDTITEVYGLHASGAGMASHKEFQAIMESMTLLKRLPSLKEVADTAVFIASDQASAITGTVINLSCGSVVD